MIINDKNQNDIFDEMEINYVFSNNPINRIHKIDEQENKTQLLVDLEKKITDADKDLTSDTIKYNVYTLGTSNNIEDHLPAWDLVMIRNEISSSTTRLTASYGDQNIPQINVEIEYTMSVSNLNDEPNPRGLAPSPELQVGRVFEDGTYLKIEPNQAIFRILEISCVI